MAPASASLASLLATANHSPSWAASAVPAVPFQYRYLISIDGFGNSNGWQLSWRRHDFLHFLNMNRRCYQSDRKCIDPACNRHYKTTIQSGDVINNRLWRAAPQAAATIDIELTIDI